ncbi:MAG TPA: argininosuccinate lyase [Gemmatimonadales bacterium]|nr:argininosuccinate lyase [Gemmatimonadales bacterium]
MTTQRRTGAVAQTLWGSKTKVDAQMLAYTVADDREVDARLVRWDILGSLGHLAGLERGGALAASQGAALRRALRQALVAATSGRLTIGPAHEDVHSAVEFWLTRRFGDVGERIHAGRSRNDQVATDLRLYLRDALLTLHGRALDVAAALTAFAARHRTALWPGYTHQRRAMPSSAALWALAHAEGLLDTAESLDALWRRVDRCPLGSAAGYGAPLPYDRRAAARALGFAAPVASVTSVQNERGKLEGAVLAWCAEFGHDLAKLSSDVILFSAAEFGWLVLPAELATGSSIMPQKRNPDLFELTRARAAQVEGARAEVAALARGLPSGYHRDFQFLKAPLFRGLDRTAEMLAMMAAALPRLGVDRARGLAALQGEILATDEALRRTRAGESFRAAYRAVAAEVKAGRPMPRLGAAELIAARRVAGGVGAPAIAAARRRLAAARRWNARARRGWERAMARLAGRRG